MSVGTDPLMYEDAYNKSESSSQDCSITGNCFGRYYTTGMPVFPILAKVLSPFPTLVSVSGSTCMLYTPIIEVPPQVN